MFRQAKFKIQNSKKVYCRLSPIQVDEVEFFLIRKSRMVGLRKDGDMRKRGVIFMFVFILFNTVKIDIWLF